MAKIDYNALSLHQEFWEPINVIGRKWRAANEAQDNNARQQCILEAMEAITDSLLYNTSLKKEAPQLWDNYVAITGDFLTKFLIEYNPSRSPLSAYVNFKLKKMQMGISLRQDYDSSEGIHYRTIKGGEKLQDTEDPEIDLVAQDKPRDKIQIQYISMDSPVTNRSGEESTACLRDLYEDDRLHAPDSALLADELLLEIMTQIIQIKPSAKTPINYKRLFFTDSASSYIRLFDSAATTLRHEDELFSTMQLMFLDFFMNRKCRSVRQLCAAEVKSYASLVEGRENVPCRQPFPGDVYQSYLKKYEHYTASTAAISMQRTQYKEFIESLCSTSQL